MVQLNEEKTLLTAILKEFEGSSDLVHITDNSVHITYLEPLVKIVELRRAVLEPLQKLTSDKVTNYLLHNSEFQSVSSKEDAIKGVLTGEAVVHHLNLTYLIDVSDFESRSVEKTETETVISGPHDAFVESLSTNISLIRRRLKSEHLKTIKLEVGSITKTEVMIFYMEGIADEALVQMLQKRLETVKIDTVLDSAMLVQYIDDSRWSIFPQYLTTERPDSAVSKLTSGRVVGVVDQSPSVFVAPTTFFEFFNSPDDYYQRWAIGSFTRILRFVALLITLFFTALYVAVTTFHYEMVPEAMLVPLAESRERVPFPPLYEALLMEIVIELLREAGARLPTKIGQTIGIVGGIVIGQAAVQAGFTSHILIISVAISAITSFVIPSYVMSASIRILRFGIILLAGWWGNFGIMIGVTFLVIHLSGLTNLKAPYLMPIAPLSIKDLLDTFIRAPFSVLRSRPSVTKTDNKKKGDTS